MEKRLAEIDYVYRIELFSGCPSGMKASFHKMLEVSSESTLLYWTGREFPRVHRHRPLVVAILPSCPSVTFLSASAPDIAPRMLVTSV